MINRFIFAVLVVVSLLFPLESIAQGCVAVRPMGCSAAGASTLQKDQWQLVSSYRFFKSFRHFRGDVEETERVEHGTQVVNLAHSLDFSISRALTKRLALTLNVPLVYYDRSSLYEHLGNSTTANPDQLRFHTYSKGLGDIRFSGSYWIFNPDRVNLNGNISAGIGVKAPTGNSNFQGDFHKRSSEGTDSIVTRAVDQSIQPGDGGWGFTMELQAFQKVLNQGSIYFNGFYMFNPENENNTLTRGTIAGVNPLIAYHSIADQYAARFGFNYGFCSKLGLSASLGGRVEGVPAKDILGKSEGFRRPGYVISAEPGLSFMYKSLNLSLNVPFALYRNRVKSVYDLADPKGERHGDAAFADYLVNFTASIRFGKKHSVMMEEPVE